MDRVRKLRQVAVLSSSSFALRLMGMLFRAYLGQRIGAAGLGLNQLVMSVYLFLSLLSTQAVASAVLRLCAETPACAKGIARRAAVVSGAFGLFLGGCLYLLAPLLCRGPLQAEALLPLRLLAPALPLTGVSSCLKGYFLGRAQSGRVTACQLTEQLGRIALAVFLMERSSGGSVYELCALQLLAVTAGELLSLLCYLFLFLRAPKDLSPAPPALLPKLARISLPILGSTLVRSGMQTLETLLIPPLLRASGSDTALEDLGLLNGMVMPVLFFPAAIPSAILTVQLPAAVRLTVRGRTGELRAYLRRSLAPAFGFSVLCAALFAGLSGPMMRLLYHNTEAGALLLLLSPLMPFLYLDRLCDELLLSLGRQRAALWLEIGDSGLRLCLLLLLLPRFGLRGMLLLTAASACFGCFARLRCLLSACGCDRAALPRLLLSALPSLLCALPALLLCLALSVSGLPPLVACACGFALGTAAFLLACSLQRLLAHGRRHAAKAEDKASPALARRKAAV